MKQLIASAIVIAMSLALGAGAVAGYEIGKRMK